MLLFEYDRVIEIYSEHKYEYQIKLSGDLKEDKLYSMLLGIFNLEYDTIILNYIYESWDNKYNITILSDISIDYLSDLIVTFYKGWDTFNEHEIKIQNKNEIIVYLRNIDSEFNRILIWLIQQPSKINYINYDRDDCRLDIEFIGGPELRFNLQNRIIEYIQREIIE